MNAKLLKNFNFSFLVEGNTIFFRYFSTILLLLFALLIGGCEKFTSKTVAQMCSEEPDICNDLNPDAWCRAEKADIIKHRYQQAEPPTHAQQYQLILFFEDYQDCISKAAQIRHKQLREKETGRMKGLLTAQNELKRLAYETRNIDDPYLSYYQWSRHGHDDALARFLRFERNGELNTAPLQVGLASYHAKRDTGKAINALYTALSLYTEEEAIDPEIFTSLYTLHQQRGESEMAVVFALIAKEYDKNDVDLATLQRLASDAGLDFDYLQKRAGSIHGAIEAREFSFSS
ncbi:DUF2989 domain-containing protein [Alteromonas flava]|uniref:DUF2989 domain-containing protein n=1 Tax=Alteromonas flava TaxID=2048003 RepID=UPI000C28E1AC|nr:DUF2989 domain-containing protein [Alteromonas flava]